MNKRRNEKEIYIRYLHGKGYKQMEIAEIVECSQQYVSKVIKITKKKQEENTTNRTLDRKVLPFDDDFFDFSEVDRFHEERSRNGKR